MKFLTEQENFWAKGFGDRYIKRNQFTELLPKKVNLFSEIFKNIYPIKNLIEFGPNSGVNLMAIKNLKPLVELNAVEINSKAVSNIKKFKLCKDIWNESILNFKSKRKFDLTFTSGVLIHINPDFLNLAYKALYNNSKKYILIIEYYNPSPVQIKYRGHEDKLYKRDFAGEILEKYKNVTLLDYGFKYRLDNNFPLDDVTWFLLEKK